MLETSGRYFQLTVQSIRRVLDTGSPSHSPRLVAAATEALPVDTWMRRQDLTMRTQSRLLAVIRQAADGAGSKES